MGLDLERFMTFLNSFDYHSTPGIYEDFRREVRAKQIVEIVDYSFNFTGETIKILAVNEKGETVTIQRPS